MGKNADERALLEKNAKIDTSWAYEGKYLKVRHDTIHVFNSNRCKVFVTG